MAKYLRKPKKNIPMYAAGALFCLTLITTYMASGLFARYSTTETGSDSARIIKFGDISISEEGDFLLDSQGQTTNQLLILPGVDIWKQAVVNFEGSEAATYVFLEVALSGDWSYENRVFAIQDRLEWKIRDSWNYLIDETNDTVHTYVFYQALNPNVTMTSQTVIDANALQNAVSGDAFVVTEDPEDANHDGKTRYTVSVSPQISQNQIGALTDISVSFRASVVQSSGFDNANAAWQSLTAKEGAV